MDALGTKPMHALLKGLRDVDAACVLLIRKTRGLHVAAFREHFEAYGRVHDVLVPQPQQRRRMRPSNIAFVIMAEAGAAQAAVAAGREQVVAGCWVAVARWVPVARYEPRAAKGVSSSASAASTDVGTSAMSVADGASTADGSRSDGDESVDLSVELDFQGEDGVG